MGNIQPLFLDVAVVASNAPLYARRSLLVAEGPPSPQCIDAAPPDAKAAVGVCWYILEGEDTPGGAAPGGRTAAIRQYHHRALAGGGLVRS